MSSITNGVSLQGGQVADWKSEKTEWKKSAKVLAIAALVIFGVAALFAGAIALHTLSGGPQPVLYGIGLGLVSASALAFSGVLAGSAIYQKKQEWKLDQLIKDHTSP